MKSLEERVRGKFTTGPECWEWTAAKDRGYGKICHGGRNLYAHRVLYELLVGPIPEGLELDHLCRNHSCVRFDHHLEPVTRRVNLMRGETVVAANAAKTHCKFGHEYTDANTYHLHGRRVCRTCKRAKEARHRARRKKERTMSLRAVAA